LFEFGDYRNKNDYSISVFWYKNSKLAMNKPVKVLYIAGTGRSGSTILGNILGQVKQYIHVGEVQNIWRYFLSEHRSCTCGKSWEMCEIWGPVIHQAFGEINGKFSQEMEFNRLRSNRNRFLPLFLIQPLDSVFLSRRRQYLENLSKLYCAIQSETGCEVIIDSSKRPTYGRLVELLPNIEFFTVHLVRDPRAVAHSWHRNRMQTDGSRYEKQMQKMKSYKTAMRWNVMNFATEIFWRGSPRYLELRYEDMVKYPRKSIQRILNMLNGENKKLPFVGNNTVELSLNHLVWGNPNRHKTGLIDLKLDDEWKYSLGKVDKFTVDFLTIPLRSRYRYMVGD
jgi:hypothetical protein